MRSMTGFGAASAEVKTSDGGRRASSSYAASITALSS